MKIQFYTDRYKWNILKNSLIKKNKNHERFAPEKNY
jgi:hypothetical protein